MRKIALILFVFFGCIWAEVKIEQELQIEITSDYFPDYCHMENEFDSTEICNTYIDERIGKKTKSWCYESVCQSILDSNIFFQVHDYTHGECYLYSEEGCWAFDFYVLTGASHSLMDVIRDEFLNYQRCNLLCVSTEKLDSMFNEMDRVLAPELEEKDNLPYYIINGEEKTFMLDCGIGGPCLWGAHDGIDSILAVRNAPQSLPYRVDFAASVRMENGRLVVPRESENREFVLLNLNGRILRRGKLRNNMLLPHEPTILRIKNIGEVYLK